GVADGKDWERKAEKRKALINKYCWDEKRGIYLDYDFKNKRHSKLAAATCFSPLYAGIASPQQAKRVVNNLKLLETDFGLVTTEFSEQKHVYQWDHISVWAPMQALAIIGLDKYGFKDDAKRISSKYLDLVSKNFFSPLPNSYMKDSLNVIRKPFKVYEKYTSDGKINDREYIANTMWGWSAGVWGLAYKYVIDKKTSKK
ncbi:MAG TPA: trehalase family glycosidase, partial [Cytophagaceae bacterium]